MVKDLPSTLEKARFIATCKHCPTVMMGYTLEDMLKHLGEHDIGIHFKDVRVVHKRNKKK